MDLVMRVDSEVGIDLKQTLIEVKCVVSSKYDYPKVHDLQEGTILAE